jgi:hypothetical protein
MANEIRFCTPDNDVVLDDDGAACHARVDTNRWVNLGHERRAESAVDAPTASRRSWAQRRCARGGELAGVRRT